MNDYLARLNKASNGTTIDSHESDAYKILEKRANVENLDSQERQLRDKYRKKPKS